MTEYTPGQLALKAAWVAQRVVKGADEARAAAEFDRAIAVIKGSAE